MTDHARGEKVVFGRQDIPPLEALPSHDDSAAIVLAAPRQFSWTRRFVKVVALLVLLAGITIGGLFVALENGVLDSTLTAQAEAGMSRALGDKFRPEVGSVRLRFSKDWMLAIEARQVVVTHLPSSLAALKADSVRAVLDPFALVAGRVRVTSAELGSANADISFLPAGLAVDWGSMRIDGVPAWLDLLYPLIDGAVVQLDRAGTTRVSAQTMSLVLPGDQHKVVRVDGFEFGRDDGRLTLTGAVSYDTIRPTIAIAVEAEAGRARALDIKVAGLSTTKLLMRYDRRNGLPRDGLDAPLTFSFAARRDASVGMLVNADTGTFYANGIAQAVTSALAKLDYDIKGQKVEISDALIDLGATKIPFNGAIIDVERVKPELSKGYAFEIVANDAVAQAAASEQAPEPFNAVVKGYFLSGAKTLHLDQIGLSMESGSFAGTLDMRFGDKSPAINFSARADRLSTKSVKQLWPYWFGAKSRDWVLTHIQDGTVTNAAIDVSLAAGRIPEHPEPLAFRDKELQISFDASDLGLSYLGDLPAASDISGRFDLTDERLKIDIAKGNIVLPSGKVLKAESGQFLIAQTSKKPLMASLDILASGDAAPLLEYASFKPLEISSRLPFRAVDVSGRVKAKVSATFGLNRAQKPPKPAWNVDLDLANVALKTAFEGRQISDVNGKLKVDSQSAILDAKARIDGQPFDIKLNEPIDAKSKKRTWSVKGAFSQTEIRALVPALEGYLTGKVGVTLESGKDALLMAQVSLTDAGLTIPVVNWTKGPGIRATAKFGMKTVNGRTEISSFSLEGDDFGVKGEATLDKSGLVSGSFSRIKLSPADNFAVSVQRKSGGMVLKVSGSSLDAKPFIDTAKAPAQGKDSRGPSVSVSARLDRVVGYNKESLGDLDLSLAVTDGRLSTVSLKAVTASGQAVIIEKPKANSELKISSGDAGAVARFADFYRNMNGGLLNITLKARGDGSLHGPLDIRNFALLNEARLKAIVQARSGEDGRSLTDALKSDIDTSSQKFKRGFARLRIERGSIRVENGLARGDQVGATFQGTVRDAQGRMDLTGTFMPAYGLNRLFGELPLIGSILGNGRDRGLLGITFKLEGPFENPKMTVNPLSIIAPGVFRNIFEFE